MKVGLRVRLAVFFGAAVAGALLAFSAAVILVLGADERAERTQRGQTASVQDLVENAPRVLFSMALVAPFAVGGAAAIGLWLAGRALAPLKEANSRARAARASTLDLTLPLRGTGDEWDALATTLNALLLDGRTALERIRRFTADAAHELRTPLTAILGEAEVALRRDHGKDELRASLSIVREQAARLAGVLDALLLLARADAGDLIVLPAIRSLTALLREAADLAQPEAAAHEPSVEISGDDVQIRCEPVLLVRALRNLIENGLRHGGGKVQVRLSSEAGRATVRVEDRGPGISASLRPLLFERFASGDPARSTGGLGLGLSIARAIAVAHGGTLEHLPSPRGAVFALVVPLARQE